MSPKKRAQKRELDNLKLHYELLSKKMEESSNVLRELQERDNNWIIELKRPIQKLYNDRKTSVFLRF